MASRRVPASAVPGAHDYEAWLGAAAALCAARC